MKGISKDRLLKLREHFNKDYSIVEAKVIQDLLNECKELNPWMTLDEFLKSGFEGDCRIYLRSGYDGIGKFNNNTFSYRHGEIKHESISHVQPIHKPEPPR